MTDVATTPLDSAAEGEGENVELARRVLRHVIARPERHQQSRWIDGDTADEYEYHLRGLRTNPELIESELSCPTTACLAGWTLLLAGGEAGTVDARRSLVTAMVEIVNRTDGWDGVFGAYGATAWTTVAADRLRVTDPGRVIALRHIFLTTTSPFRESSSIQDNELASRRFAELFDLDYDALCAEVAAEVTAEANTDTDTDASPGK